MNKLKSILYCSLLFLYMLLLFACSNETRLSKSQTMLEVSQPRLYHCPSINEIVYQDNGYYQAETTYNNAYIRWNSATFDKMHHQLLSFIGADLYCQTAQECSVDCIYDEYNIDQFLHLWAINSYEQRFLPANKQSMQWQSNQCRSMNINDCSFYIHN